MCIQNFSQEEQAATAPAQPVLEGEANATGQFVAVAPFKHGHNIADVVGLQAALDSKQPATTFKTINGQAVTGSGDIVISVPDTTVTDVAWGEITDKPITFPPSMHDHSWADLTDKPATFVAASHSHAITDVTGLQSTLDGKSPSDHSHAWNDVTNKPTKFAPSAHSHTVANVTGLQGLLDGKAAATHAHAWGDVTGKPTTFPSSAHNHAITDVTGLQTALDGKQPATTFKTINGQAVTGLGDIVIPKGDKGDTAPVVILTEPPTSFDAGTFYVITGHLGHVHEPSPAPVNNDAYVAERVGEHDGHSHTPGVMADEHQRMLALAPRMAATHVAVTDGPWSNPGTWWKGAVPPAGAAVFIPHDRAVVYDSTSADIKTLRLDGSLTFRTDVQTKMAVDTAIVSGTGKLNVGTTENPVQPDVSAQILFPDAGPLDPVADETLLGRGLISHGTVNICGAEKLAFSKVVADPMKGATSLTLQKAPVGWKVGDKILLTGTYKRGWEWTNTLVNFPGQDEKLTITAISGNQITFTPALVHNHDTPRVDLKADVINTERNVTFASPEGTAVHRRGHVMLMHSDKIRVSFAAFDHMGRTDKSKLAHDDAKGPFPYLADENVKGRYPLHLHKCGAANQDNPVQIVGCSITNSPGWGYGHHSSHANFDDCVAVDCWGAGFAAEDGDETGRWLRCIATGAKGTGRGDGVEKDFSRLANHDNGHAGIGFFFAGRAVHVEQCVAANNENGYFWMHRSAPLGVLNENAPFDIYWGADRINSNVLPIQKVDDCEAYCAGSGFLVLKAGPIQNHDLRSQFNRITAWEVRAGLEPQYTSRYTFTDLDFVGTKNTNSQGTPRHGFIVGTNSFNMVINRAKITGFPVGVSLVQSMTDATPDSEFNHVLIDVDASTCPTPVAGFNSARHKILTAADLVPGRLSVAPTGPTAVIYNQPAARSGIKTDSIGAVHLDMGTDKFHFPHNQLYGLNTWVKRYGYWTDAQNKKHAVFIDYVSDQVTGAVLPYERIINIEGLWGALPDKESLVNNGTLMSKKGQ